MTPSDLSHLFSLTNEYRSIKYDLGNMQVLLERLGNPQTLFRSVLVAGTNGKGSVCAFLSNMMPEAGLYTSPHLQRVNERIRIGQRQISDTDLAEVHKEVSQAAAVAKGLLYPPTYFELMTAMAFVYFRGRTDFAVLEVGMGGRLDATNVVRQDVSVITSIGLDHQEFLGQTIEDIVVEKAGIIKSHEPVVIGPDVEFEVIRKRAGERLYMTRPLQREVRSLGDGYLELDVTTPIRKYSNLRPRLVGRHQVDNVLVAIRTAECLKLARQEIEQGINNAEWPGRLERIVGELTFLLDGAHNEQAVRALCGFLAETYPRGVPMIFGCMADKNYKEMLNLLRPRVQEVIFTRVENSRSKDPAELQQLWPGSRVTDSVADAIGYALLNYSAVEPVLVCGSLYLIGEARHLLVQGAQNDLGRQAVAGEEAQGGNNH